MTKKILIADDNEDIIDILRLYVRKEGWVPLTARTGREALAQFRNTDPDLVLLDVMMPEGDGYLVCSEIRKTSNVPIIMITAKAEDGDRITGLDIGADDYVIKPFSPGEVMARIRANFRRLSLSSEHHENELHLPDLDINLAEYRVTVKKQEIALTKKEVELLWIFAKNPARVYTREILLDQVWGVEYEGDIRTVDTHMKRLRSKLLSYSDLAWELKTVWGVGYKFALKSEVQDEE